MTPRILVTGSRRWRDHEAIREVLAEVLATYSDRGVPTLVHGDCAGADLIAAVEWGRLGHKAGLALGSETFCADWGRHGKAAGPRRNQRMVDAGADLCLAFPLPDSHGTWDCVRRAEAASIPVQVIGPATPTPSTTGRKPGGGT